MIIVPKCKNTERPEIATIGGVEAAQSSSPVSDEVKLRTGALNTRCRGGVTPNNYSYVLNSHLYMKDRGSSK